MFQQNNNQSYSPYRTTQQQSYQQNPSFIWVNGLEMAINWPVPIGSSMIMMDSQNPSLYIKSVDQTGRVLPIEIYDLVKREQDPKDTFVTRRELEDLFERYLGSKPKSNKNKKRDDNEVEE